MSKHSVVHSTFVIQRSYKASPEAVFRAFSDKAMKLKWFGEGEGREVVTFNVDCRVGAIETSTFRLKSGAQVRNETHYHDVIENERIVTSYTMTVNDKRISASLGTTELVSSGGGTQLTYTEQGAFFDGADMPEGREAGCRALFEALAKAIE